MRNTSLGGDGQSASSILVRAIRLVVTEPNLQRVPPGTELVVASAASGLPEIVATLTAGSAPAASERPIAAVPLSTRAPIDTTIDLTGGIGTRDVDNGNANDNEDNDNDNEDNDNGGAPAATPSSGTQRPIVVTVVVVVATPGATATLPGATATLPAATATLPAATATPRR